MKTLVIIPAFNEAGKLLEVVKDLRKHGYNNILTIDDGSSDDTSLVAKKARVMSVRHILNRGLGSALGTGFEYARAEKSKILITFDADGQHQGKDIK